MSANCHRIYISGKIGPSVVSLSRWDKPVTLSKDMGSRENAIVLFEAKPGGIINRPPPGAVKRCPKRGIEADEVANQRPAIYEWRADGRYHRGCKRMGGSKGNQA